MKKSKLKSKKNKSFKKADNYTAVLLEKMHDDIKLVAEGQVVVQRQLDEFKGEMHEFKEDTKSSFKSILEYLSRMEDEIMEIKEDLKNNYERKGWDKEWRDMIERKLEKIEKTLVSKNLMVKIS